MPDASSKRLSLSQLKRMDRLIRAFADLDKAQPVSRTDQAGDLQGVTVGVKDVIDVAGFPTRNGSETCRETAAATTDAAVVRALRSAGATILGKTTTTEFAFTDPTDCRNPYDLSRSPGGSSSGSGAAVAAGMVDIALGTQTAGSLCRPAAYCGAVGFKPSYGVLPTQGVTPLAPSFDTVGIIARSVSLAERAFDAVRAKTDGPPEESPGQTRMTAFLWDAMTEVAPETMMAFQQARDALARLFDEAKPPDLPIDVASVVSDHRIVMNREAFEAHGALLADATVHLLKPGFRAALQTGSAVSVSEVQMARERLASAKQAFWRSLDGVEFVLTLAVPDGAPLIDGTTGFQHWLTPWTVFGGPLICLPWGLDSIGRPTSVMLAGHPGQDHALLRTAAMLEARSPDLPRPTLPQ